MDKKEQGHWDHALMVIKLTDEIERLQNLFDVERSDNIKVRDLLAKANEDNERLREALQEIKKRNPFHNVSPPMDKQYYAQIITEMVGIANAALKEGEVNG